MFTKVNDTTAMKRFIKEDFSFIITVIGGKRSAHGMIDCRNGHEVGDTYSCEYGCPMPQNGEGGYMNIDEPGKGKNNMLMVYSEN